MKTTPACVLVGLAVAGGGWVARGADPAQPVVEVDRYQVDFLAGSGQLVGRYHRDARVAKPYFWPVNGPGGVPLTRAWPMEKASPGGSTDHPHQKSAWFCHGDVIPEGLTLKTHAKGVKGVDFWSEQPGHGRIVCTEVGEPQFGKDHVRLPTRNEWRTADGVKLLDEARTLHFYDYGDTRLLVVDIDLLAAAAPVTFGDTKEGSFGVRVNDGIRAQGGRGKIQNAHGKTGEAACWGQTAAWCDYSGPIDGKTVGIAILDDPRNPYPACWHVRGYGLMAANPFGRARSGFPAVRGRDDLVKLAKGEHLKLRYGLLLHPGDAGEGQVGEYYQRFIKLKPD
jgi:hypothetical protein